MGVVLRKLKFVGLDGEMSGSEIDKGAALIQIGFALWNKENVEMIHMNMNPGEMTWSEEAEKVHNIPISSVKKSSAVEQVDKNAYEWLFKRGLRPEYRTTQIAVGFNVGSFDMPFLRKYMPLTASLFSRRTVDLNALCFALDGKHGLNSLEYKKQAKSYAIKQIGPIGLAEHNAGYDSLIHLYGYRYLSKIIWGAGNNE